MRRRGCAEASACAFVCGLCVGGVAAGIWVMNVTAGEYRQGVIDGQTGAASVEQIGEVRGEPVWAEEVVSHANP